MTPILSRISLILIVALVLAACSYPTRNLPLVAPVDPVKGYRGGQVLEGVMPKTLVVLTISGGGTRAAALGHGTMRGLSAIKLGGRKETLLHAVDIVSSVSGGSVPATWLALAGPEPAKLDKFRSAFLDQDGMGRLTWRILNPYGLLRISTAQTERIDPLIDWFNDTLFDGATYAALRSRDAVSGWRRPYLIVNAADMAAEAPFPFHQWRFDLLCSDLEDLPLAVSVAASAAFPILLSPVTLVNYSKPGGCAAQKEAGHDLWPPQWVQQTNNDTATENQPRTSIYTNPARVRRARTGYSYIDVDSGELRRPFVHLLDGGIADNLGLAEPIRLLTTREISPSLLSHIDRGRIERILLLVVNARSDPDSDLDRTKATPGVLSMLGATTGSAIDNATFRRLEQLDEVIRALMQAAGSRRAASLAIDHALVDFDMIGNPTCRRRFQNIATSWALARTEVDALIGMGEALMWKHPGFRMFIARHEEALAAPGWTAEESAARESSICDELLAHTTG